MKYITLLFLFIMTIYSCESTAQINIPDAITVSNIENKINVKGTKVLINESQNYKY